MANERLNPEHGAGGPWPCNRNLLDNWYFGNPVNQRGQAEYTVNGYSIDRWYVPLDGVIVNNGYISLKQSVIFLQKFERPFVNGTHFTFSLLTKENELISTSFQFDESFDWTGYELGQYCSLQIGNNYWGGQGLGFLGYKDLDLIAAKLELGSQQTLAHKEGDIWVLNEIPDYGEQLARCQRYYWDSSGLHYAAGFIDAFGRSYVFFRFRLL